MYYKTLCDIKFERNRAFPHEVIQPKSKTDGTSSWLIVSGMS